MGTFKQLQRKSNSSSTCAALTSHRLRPSRSFAPAPISIPRQVSPDQQTQPAHGSRLSYSLADIPIFPPERENRTGLPDNLKASIENLSGMSMDDVHVHYNSPKPTSVQALAYTQGTDIHVGPNQEQHLVHEAWHVVQQKQGRVKPTLQLRGMSVNDDLALEQEADSISSRASDWGLRNRHDTVPPAAHTQAGNTEHSTHCGCSMCADRSQASQDTTTSPGNEAASSSPVIQRMCTYCDNVFCNNGSICGGKKKSGKYAIGQHGAKGREQRRLSAAPYGVRVSGKNFESEHTIGYQPLSQTSNLKRGKGKEARDLENKAPAYQERKEFHRDNIGTGTRNTPDKSGFTSETYRNTQRSLIEQGAISPAVQINQLTYAYQPNFQSTSNTPEARVATDSYNAMVGSMNNLTYAQKNTTVTNPVDARDKAEMIAARKTVELGRYLTGPEIAEIYEQVNIEEEFLNS